MRHDNGQKCPTHFGLHHCPTESLGDMLYANWTARQDAYSLIAVMYLYQQDSTWAEHCPASLTPFLLAYSFLSMIAPGALCLSGGPFWVYTVRQSSSCLPNCTFSCITPAFSKYTFNEYARVKNGLFPSSYLTWDAYLWHFLYSKDSSLNLLLANCSSVKCEEL